MEGGRFLLLPAAESVLKLLVFFFSPLSVLNHASLLFVVQESLWISGESYFFPMTTL